MKKILIAFMIIMCLIPSTGCEPVTAWYTYETLSDIVSIELIYYDNNDAIKLVRQRDKVKPFDFSKSTVIKVLDSEKTKEFILELSGAMYIMQSRFLDSPKGESVKMNYKDGSFRITCCNAQFSCRYDEFGNVKYVNGRCADPKLKELVEKFFYKEL